MLSHIEQIKMGKSVPNVKVPKKTTRNIRKKKWLAGFRSGQETDDQPEQEKREIKVKETENQTLTGIIAKTLTRVLAKALTGIIAKTLTRILAMALTGILARTLTLH